MRRKMMVEDKKWADGGLLPIRDGRGNFLAIGNEVVFTGVSKMSHMVGKVIGFDPGGMSIVETNENKPKQTMARLRIVFDMTIQVPPQSPYVVDLFRVINPDSEVILAKILDPEIKLQ
jgi:hypothetical protein